MLAVRFYGVGDVRVEDVPMPVCGPGEALVRVAYAGICGSDLHVYRKGMFVTSVPVTMGHEFSGVVEELGAGVTALQVGDHVVGDPRVTCGCCNWCLKGSFNLCPGLGFIGEVSPGCLADYIVLRTDRLLQVPKSVDLKNAALVEPLAVALHIAQAGRFTCEDSLGIIGAGPIGLLTLLTAGVMGVKGVAMVDISQARLELAQKLGAHSTFKVIPEYPKEIVDVAIEAVGVEATLNGAAKWLRPRGRLVLAGLYEDTILIDPNEILVKELNLAGINAYGTEDLEKAIEWLAAGELDVSAVVSHVLPLKEAASSFEMLTSQGKNAAKVLLAAGV